MHIANRCTFWRRFYEMLDANDNKNSVWATHAPSDMHVLLASVNRWESRGSSFIHLWREAARSSNSLSHSLSHMHHTQDPQQPYALSPQETPAPKLTEPSSLHLKDAVRQSSYWSTDPTATLQHPLSSKLF